MAAKKDKPKKVVSLAGTGRLTHVSISRKRWKEAQEDQERAHAIVGDIAFDILLAAIIEGTFPKRTKDVQNVMNNPNINMALKARLAYILGLIDKTVRNDLLKIHDIRCKFAHSFEASFAHTEVLKLVQKLSTAKDHKATAKNSHELFKSTGIKCRDHVMAVYEKQKAEKAQ